MDHVLERLCRQEYVSGEELSREMGMTRAAIWKKIEALRENGWEIESCGKRGYRLNPGDRLEPVLWESRLQTGQLGRGENRFAPVMDSTNHQVKEMAVAGAAHGSLALCEQQTAGRGRLGRTWVSHSGVGLWHSLLLRPQMHPSQAPFVTFLCAMAMARALADLGFPDGKIKWPNDLVLGGRKICGILNEVSCDMDHIEYLVLGVGLNVLRGSVPPELSQTAGCLEDAGPVPYRRDILVRYLFHLEALLHVLQREGFPALTEDYRAMSCTLGRPVKVIGNGDTQSFQGVAEAMDDTGALLVRDPDGVLRRVLAGDVSVRGVMGYV